VGRFPWGKKVPRAGEREKNRENDLSEKQRSWAKSIEKAKIGLKERSMREWGSICKKNVNTNFKEGEEQYELRYGSVKE